MIREEGWKDTPFYRPKRSGEYALLEHQIKKLLLVVGKIDHEVLLRIAIECGLRRGDVIAIEQANVDLENGWITFYETKKRMNHRVPLSPSLSKLITQYLNVVGKNKWLFPSTHNSKKHISSKTAWNTLNKYLINANLPQRPFHALRATCIKLCQRKGWSIEQVMKLTNDTFRTIKEHYDVPSEEEMLEVAKSKPIFEGGR